MFIWGPKGSEPIPNQNLGAFFGSGDRAGHDDLAGYNLTDDEGVNCSGEPPSQCFCE